jgi:hypothetical protein
MQTLRSRRGRGLMLGTLPSLMLDRTHASKFPSTHCRHFFIPHLIVVARVLRKLPPARPLYLGIGI